MNVATPISRTRDPTAGGATAAVRSGRRGGRSYFAASVLAQACALIRYVVLARLLGPQQLGLAATLVVTAAFFDLVSDTGADRFLIQNRHGDEAQVQKLVQLVYLGRGLLVAGALVVFAIPIARFYGQPPLAEGFAVLALSPLILGFLHLDIRRTQREHDFRAEAVCIIGAETSGLVATALAAWLTHDFTAILYGLITRALVRVALSHVWARRPYRLGWDRQHAPALMRFSTPLMLNGFMLFVVSQSDRVIIGRQLGMTTLGYYSAIILLIYYPSAVIVNYVHAIYIPLVAAQRDRADGQNRVSDVLGGQTLVLALVMAAGFAIVTPVLAPILFGRRFTQAALLVGLIGILQTTRALINWPTTVALAMGRSTTVLISNLAHLFVFPGAFVGYLLIGGLAGVVAGFIAGEVIAVAIALMMLNRDMGRHPLHGFDRLGVFALLCGDIVGCNMALSARQPLAETGMAVCTVGLCVWIFRREAATITTGMSAARRAVSALVFRSKRP